MTVQVLVELAGSLQGHAFHRAGERVAPIEQIFLAAQFFGLDRFFQFTVGIEQSDFGPCRDIEAGLDNAAIGEWKSDAGIGTDEAIPAHGYKFTATARERAHGAAASAQIAVCSHHHPGRDTAFDHGGTFGAGIKIDESFMHDGGALTEISPQPYPGCVSDTATRGHNIARHPGKFVHRHDFQAEVLQACLQLSTGQVDQVDGALVSPGDVNENTKQSLEIQGIRLGESVGQQVQLQIGFGNRGRRRIAVEESDNHQLGAGSQTLQQIGGRGLVALAQCLH